MKNLIYAITFAWLFTVPACEDFGVEPREVEEAEIRETVFRYYFTHEVSCCIDSGVVSDSVKFFGLAGAELDSVFNIRRLYDLDDGFMSGFNNVQRPVRKYSQLRFSSGGAVYDQETGGRAVLFWVGPVRWVDSDHVQIGGGYLVGGLNAEGDVFFITRRHSFWRVDTLELKWYA
jgi:hypothetical protein